MHHITSITVLYYGVLALDDLFRASNFLSGLPVMAGWCMDITLVCDVSQFDVEVG